MIKINFQFLIFNFQLILLFAACNNLNINPNERQTQSSFAPDSLWTPTGDVKLDSLLQLAAIAPPDTTLAMLYYQIGDIYENIDFEQAKAYYQKLGNLSEQLEWHRGSILFASGFSLVLMREGASDSALVILQDGYELAKRQNNDLWINELRVNKGNAYNTKGWYETALTHYIEALPFGEKQFSTSSLKVLYQQMAQIYAKINLSEKAVEYGEKSVALDREDPASLLILGRAYDNLLQYEKGKEYLEEALRFATLQNNIYAMNLIYYHLASNATMVFDLERAELYARKTMEICGQFGDAFCFTAILISSKIEQLKGNFVKSEELVKEALQIAIEYEAYEEMRSCYIILSELSVAQRKYRENIMYWEKFGVAEEAVSRETAVRAGEEMFAKYETAKKEHEIERQQLIISRQNLQRSLLVVGVVVCLVILALLWFMLRLRNSRNRELAEINATKDKFFSIISHDLKNPAVTQRDALRSLVNNGRMWDADTLSDYYNELLNSAESEVELINNLLDWARIQTGRMAFTSEPFNLSTRLRTDISLARAMSEKKGISFLVDVPDHVQITGNGNMLSTIVRNLLTNAVKFTAEGGQVTLKVETNNNGRYIVSVSDNGVGMSSEQIQNFFRLDSTHSHTGTAGEQGSGLGLIVCRELLEKHGSALNVESEEGKGSRFWFELNS